MSLLPKSVGVKEELAVSLKVIHELPSTLHSTFACVWRGWAVGLRIDLLSVWIKLCSTYSACKKKKITIYLCHYLCNCSTSNIGMFGYIDVNLCKELSPRVWQIPPETFGI